MSSAYYKMSHYGCGVFDSLTATLILVVVAVYFGPWTLYANHGEERIDVWVTAETYTSRDGCQLMSFSATVLFDIYEATCRPAWLPYAIHTL